MIEMSVGKDDSLDGEIERSGEMENGICRSGKIGVDEGEGVVVFDQKAIDHAETGQAIEMVGFSNEFHLLGIEGVSPADFAKRVIFSRRPLLSETTRSAV